MLDLQTAFSIHAKGHAKLTRRMVVHIADDCAMNVREAVLAMERKGFAKDGSWDWFKANGGITSDQIDAVRADRNSTNQDGMMRSAYETPPMPCPYCGAECDADWCDVGVGMIQSGPYHCTQCYAVECGPHDEIRDDYDVDTGWYKPGAAPGKSANVGIDGRPIGYKEADTIYRAKHGVPPRYT